MSSSFMNGADFPDLISKLYDRWSFAFWARKLSFGTPRGLLLVNKIDLFGVGLVIRFLLLLNVLVNC